MTAFVSARAQEIHSLRFFYRTGWRHSGGTATVNTMRVKTVKGLSEPNEFWGKNVPGFYGGDKGPSNVRAIFLYAGVPRVII